ncbi:MAG: hypothetical protein AAFW68_06650 [Pseudomonadota bacterium]
MDANIIILAGAGAVLAGLAIGVGAMHSPAARAYWFYAQLVLMVGIYAGFALGGLELSDGISRAEGSAVLIEALTGLAFVFVGLGVLQSGRTWLLGVLILLHGLVDLLHLLLGAAHSPAWYAFACVIYDAIAGAGAIWLLSASNRGAEADN